MSENRRRWRRVAAAAFAICLSLTIGPFPLAAQATEPQAVVAKPVYRFTVDVAMATATAQRNGGYAAAISKLWYQWNTINAQFNAGGVLRATFQFSVVAGHEYFDKATDELARPHPSTNLKVIYDEDSDIVGGWNRNPQTIVHRWPADSGGSFAAYATDGLVHELGHYRGATDEYACNVQASQNPVNGTSYTEPNSVMSYPYDVRNWSAYSIGLINMQGSRTDEPRPSLASKAVPPLQAKAVNRAGKPVRARIRFYPVSWYSNAVQATPVVDTQTDGLTGGYRFAYSPYKPSSPTLANPWDLTYCGFLVRATYDGKLVDRWLPLTVSSPSYFKNPAMPYTLNIRFN